MKVIHSRISSEEKDNLHSLTSLELLIWFLSILQWKKLGYTTKIYVDDENLQFIKDKHLYELYDEVDSEYFNNTDGFFVKNNISKNKFWAGCKIFLLENESEPCIISDYDFIPFVNPALDKEVIAYHSEEVKYIYGETLDNLTFPENYEVPEWFQYNVNPVNTSICYIGNESVKSLYIEEACKYMSNNTEIEDETLVYDMVYIEQRMLAEICNHLGVEIKTLIDLNKVSYINEDYLHLLMYKDVDKSIKENNKYPNSWHIYLLDKLNKYFPETYETVINMEEFAEDKEYIEANGFDSYKVPMPLRPCKW